MRLATLCLFFAIGCAHVNESTPPAAASVPFSSTLESLTPTPPPVVIKVKCPVKNFSNCIPSELADFRVPYVDEETLGYWQAFAFRWRPEVNRFDPDRKWFAALARQVTEQSLGFVALQTAAPGKFRKRDLLYGAEFRQLVRSDGHRAFLIFTTRGIELDHVE